MTREEITSIALEEVDKNKCVLLELATGTGKTSIAIKCINKICNKVFDYDRDEATVLIVVAKTVHKDEWQKEISKWGGLNTSRVIIECYESLKKHKDSYFDIVVFDELQHLSDNRMDILKSMHINYNIIGLSATLPDNIKNFMSFNYPTGVVTHTLTDAIESDILPDPTIYLVPLKFDSLISETIIRNDSKELPIVNCSYARRWDYLRRKDIEIHIQCNKQQYLEDLNGMIEWFKRQAMSGRKWAENKWMRLCNDRLKWLSQTKNDFVLTLLDHLKNYRTLTFCSTIEQSTILGKNCIHSKNTKSDEILKKFNDKKIKHITSVNILNEGCNLSDCRIGILTNINASDIITVQRIGRILRHKKPILIIPYYPNTREQELLVKHLEGYNKDLIKTIHSIEEIEL